MPSLVKSDCEGVFAGWTEAQYFEFKRKFGGVSQSTLKEFVRSPRKFKRGIPPKSSAALSFGNLVDCLVLAPDEFEDRYVLSPFDAYRSKDAKAWKKEQLELGLTPYHETDIADAIAARDSVLNDKNVYPLLKAHSGAAQVCVAKRLPSGILTTALVDFAPSAGPYADALFDLKTTASIDDAEDYPRSVSRFMYHWQAALSLDLWNACTGEKRKRFFHIAVESSAPFECGPFEISRAAIETGRVEYRSALRWYEQCVAEDHWPSQFDNGIPVIDLPAWHKSPFIFSRAA